MIDLRSDTVTRPTAAMLDAMMTAPLGDDVWGDDPTVNAFQANLAELAGKEAALLFPSGTQSNLVALMAHCERGDEYIVGQFAHTYRYEGGGAAVLGSIQPQPIENDEDGSLPLEKISAAITKAFVATGKHAHPSVIDMIALHVTADFDKKIREGKIGVEDIQDSVEKVLSESGDRKSVV